MALRIWCNPKYFPPETHGLAISSALEVLAARGVTLEQASEAYGYAELICDLSDLAPEPPAHVGPWEDAWFEAINAAQVAAGVGKTPMGAMLVLGDGDFRLTPT